MTQGTDAFRMRVEVVFHLFNLLCVCVCVVVDEREYDDSGIKDIVGLYQLLSYLNMLFVLLFLMLTHTLPPPPAPGFYHSER